MKEKCSVCYKRFDAVMAKEMLNDDLQDIYFKCPRCGEKYHLAYTNTETRKCCNEIQAAQSELKLDRENQELLNRIKRLMKHHLELMNKLNGT